MQGVIPPAVLLKKAPEVIIPRFLGWQRTTCQRPLLVDGRLVQLVLMPRLVLCMVHFMLLLLLMCQLMLCVVHIVRQIVLLRPVVLLVVALLLLLLLQLLLLLGLVTTFLLTHTALHWGIVWCTLGAILSPGCSGSFSRVRAALSLCWCPVVGSLHCVHSPSALG